MCSEVYYASIWKELPDGVLHEGYLVKTEDEGSSELSGTAVSLWLCRESGYAYFLMCLFSFSLSDLIDEGNLQAPTPLGIFSAHLTQSLVSQYHSALVLSVRAQCHF